MDVFVASMVLAFGTFAAVNIGAIYYMYRDNKRQNLYCMMECNKFLEGNDE